MKATTALSALLPLAMCTSAPAARAWGDDGHQVVALIAYAHLSAPAKERITALLSNDATPFTMHDGRRTNSSFATQATWPDYYRESMGRQGAPYQQTHLWHFADIELHGGSLDQACSSYPPLNADQPASEGSPDDCVVDKVGQFAHELADPATAPAERQLALKFLLHLVGDLHQPLHAIDDHDAGGNGKTVHARGMQTGSLHHYWDTEFVRLWGTTPAAIATALDARISASQIRQWSGSDPRLWAKEANAYAVRIGYGQLPPPAPGPRGGAAVYQLNDDYVAHAKAAVGTQLSKAGIRLASTLNAVLEH